jgi:hypothetical protein
MLIEGLPANKTAKSVLVDNRTDLFGKTLCPVYITENNIVIKTTTFFLVFQLFRARCVSRTFVIQNRYLLYNRNTK